MKQVFEIKNGCYKIRECGKYVFKYLVWDKRCPEDECYLVDGLEGVDFDYLFGFPHVKYFHSPKARINYVIDLTQ